MKSSDIAKYAPAYIKQNEKTFSKLHKFRQGMFGNKQEGL